MYEVNLPQLLNGSMQEQKRIVPESLSINLSLAPLSTASMRVHISENIPARSWVRLFTASGDVGIFRTRTPEVDYVAESQNIELEHGVCELGDYIINDDLNLNGTMGEILTAIMAHYKGHFWALGRVECSDTIKVSIDHGNVLQSLIEALEAIPGYMFEFNQQSLPWTLNVVARPTVVSGEGRLSRNVISARVAPNDTELCTRVYMDELEGGYLDADTIQTYGLIENRISGDEALTAAEAMQMAQTYLALRKQPIQSVTLSLLDLSNITHEPLDEIRCGQMYRLVLPNGTTVEQTVVSISFSNVCTDALSAQVSLAQEVDSMVSVASGLQLQMAKVVNTYKQLNKAIIGDEQALTLLSRTVNIIGGEQQGMRIELDDLGIRLRAQELTTTDMEQTLDSAGINIAAQEGVSLYALKQSTDLVAGTVEQHSADLQVQAEQITAKVNKGNVSTQLSIELGNVTVSGGNLVVDGYVTSQGLITTLTAYTGSISASGTIAGLSLAGGSLTLNGETLTSHSITWIGGNIAMYAADQNLDLRHYHSLTATVNSSSGVVSLQEGAAQATQPEPATFNIAATTFYQNAVAAAYSQGVTDGQGSVVVDAVRAIPQGSPTWQNSVLTQTVRVSALHDSGDDYNVLKWADIPIEVDASKPYSAGVQSVSVSSITDTSHTVSPSGKVLTAITKATASNGATRSQTFNYDITAAYNKGWNDALDACVVYNVWVADRAYTVDDEYSGNSYYVLAASHREDFWKLAARK